MLSALVIVYQNHLAQESLNDDRNGNFILELRADNVLVHVNIRELYSVSL